MADLYSAPIDLDIIVQKSNATLLECLLCCETFENKQDLIKHGEGHNLPQKYQCKICYKYFSIKQSYKNHARIHKKRDKICNICGKGFYTKRRIRDHIEALHGQDKRHACPQCPKAFSALISLQGHIKNAHRAREYTCKNCGKKFSKKYVLAEHLATIHSTTRTFQCDVCKKLFATKRGIRYHITSTHTDQTYKCPYCNKYLARKTSLKVHIQNIHLKSRLHCEECRKFHEINSEDGNQLCPHVSQHEIERFFCHICNIKFRTRNELKSHSFSEHRDKKHLCDECGQVYDTVEELESHIAKHLSAKKYICDLCGNRYRGQTALKRHRLNHFEKQFQCQLCSRKFTREYLLRLHMATHLNQKTIQCHLCPRFFRSRASFKQHELLKHKTSARFVCKDCGKIFNVLRAYKQHVGYIHNQMSLECDVCKKKYRHKRKLKNHIVQHIQLGETVKDFPFSCAECSRNFKSTQTMNQHMVVHLAAANFRCDECGKYFRSFHQLQNHTKRHVKKQAHLCEQCGYVCLFEEVLENHIIKYHTNKTDENPKIEGYFPEDPQEDEVNERFSCEECFREFESLTLLRFHKETHLYECAFCKQNLRTEKLLSEHIKKDHKHRLLLHACNICSKKFNSKETLRKHLTVHKAELRKQEKAKKKVEKQEELKKKNDNEEEFKKVVSKEEKFKMIVDKEEKFKKIVDKEDEPKNKDNEQEESVVAEELEKPENQSESVDVLNLSKPQQEQPLMKKRKNKCLQTNVQTVKYDRNFKITEYDDNKSRTCQQCDLVFKSDWQWKVHRKNYHLETFRKRRKMSKLIKFVPSQGTPGSNNVNDNSQVPSTSNPAAEFARSEIINNIVNDNQQLINDGERNEYSTSAGESNTDSLQNSTNSIKSQSNKEARMLDLKNYMCEFCPSQFARRLELMEHYERAHIENIQTANILIQCQRCDKDFTREHDFIMHMNTHNALLKTLYRCPTCQRTFENNKQLDEHKLLHESNNVITENFPCPKCDIVFKSHKGIQIHLLKIHQQWKCKYCAQVFSIDYFQSHLLMHVSETVSRIDTEEMNKMSLETNVESEESYLKRQKLRTLYHCPYCDFSFTTFMHFNLHLNKVHQKAKCRPCNIILPANQLQQHMDELHKVSNTFKCDQCDAEFDNNNKLYYHRRSKHMYRCPECVMLYLPTLEIYKEHLKSHGIHVKDTTIKRRPKAKNKNENQQNVEHLEGFSENDSMNGLTENDENNSPKKDVNKQWRCAECGKVFQSKSGLRLHVRYMFQPKPRFQKIIFRCDQPWKKCDFCKKHFKTLRTHYIAGVCPEKRKRDGEKEFEQMKMIFKAQMQKTMLLSQLRRELKLRQAEEKRRKMEQELKAKEQMQSKLKGYEARRGVHQELKCQKCHGIFLHCDSFKYHTKFTCAIKNNGLPIPEDVLSKEVQILVKKMTVPEILKSTRNKNSTEIRKLLENSKRRRRPPKCFCCNSTTCYINLIKPRREYTKRVQNRNNSEIIRPIQQNTLNEEEVLQALDIKIEVESISETDCFNDTIVKRIVENNGDHYNNIENEYKKELGSAMESIKEQFSTFNAMIENNYNYYHRTWAKAGIEFCSLETAKKPLKERTWNYICHQIPIKIVDITQLDHNYVVKQQYTWEMKCNDPSPPMFVEETVRVFQDLFDSWSTLVEPFLTRQQMINLRKEIITIEVQADISNNLTIMITVYNEHTSIEKAFEYYFTYANIGNIKNITYRNIEIDEEEKTYFKRKLIYGEKLTDQVIHGIKVNLTEFQFINYLGTLEIMTKTIENYLLPNGDTTLFNIGCKNGFISLALSSKYKEVIDIDIESEISVAQNLRDYNGIDNVTYRVPTSPSIKHLVETYKNAHLHVIVNTDAQWVTNLHVMRNLRNLLCLKRIVLITTFSPKVYLPILELLTADPTFHGYPFVPVHSIVIDKTTEESQFQIVMLLLREDIYEQKPVIKTEPTDAYNRNDSQS